MKIQELFLKITISQGKVKNFFKNKLNSGKIRNFLKSNGKRPGKSQGIF